MPTILAIDVGNSRFKFGLFERGDGSSSGPAASLPVPRHTVPAPVLDPLPWAELSSRLGSRPSVAIAAGPNPAGMARLLAEWPQELSPAPRVIRDPRDLPLVVRVDHPERVGMDRLLNAVAANVLRPRGRPAIVVSSGTATTVDLVAADGAFEGGAILPGIDLAARSLHDHTALLPRLAISEFSAPDLPALGKNTSAAIRSGVFYGQVGAIKELLAQLSASAGDPIVILTGGCGALLAPRLPTARLEHDLPLRALARIA